MKYSIIIIGYNQKETVCNAIRSALEQSYRDIEVIYIDDASTDGSIEHIGSVFKDERIRIIQSKKNQGSSVARLTGIRNATGEWCLFVDGDDTLCPDACEVLSGIIEEQDEETDIIGFGANVIRSGDVDEAVFEWMKTIAGEAITGTHSSEEILEKLFIEREKAWNLWNKCYKMSVLRAAEAAASYEPLYRYTDCYLCFLACSEAEKYYGTADKLYNYYFGPGISLRTIDIGEMKHYMEANKIRAMLTDYAREKGLPEEYEHSFELIEKEIIGQSLDRVQLFSAEDEIDALQMFLDYYGKKGYSALLTKMRKQNDELSIYQEEIMKLRNNITAQQNEKAQLEAKIAQQETELEEMKTSTSWKLTEPLRNVGGNIKKVIKRQ